MARCVARENDGRNGPIVFETNGRRRQKDRSGRLDYVLGRPCPVLRKRKPNRLRGRARELARAAVVRAPVDAASIRHDEDRHEGQREDEGAQDEDRGARAPLGLTAPEGNPSLRAGSASAGIGHDGGRPPWTARTRLLFRDRNRFYLLTEDYEPAPARVNSPRLRGREGSSGKRRPPGRRRSVGGLRRPAIRRRVRRSPGTGRRSG
jgi:hypothetical protein